ncbi:Beta-hexosaminidase [Collimonas arenae]|uniref:Beta-hexosaminidase n=1 Tax=Collimonas arenae TaxID=279058 RepID=A0A0A1F8E3_9BURK|nr:beta-N-acetylhexosaminidase [Collimonas arenae]AIY40741.1 Beta-hexosaminidase [Collimonas arenae]
MSSKLEHTTTRQIAGQLIMIRMPGTVLDAETAQFLRDNHIRAVCLFRQNMVNAEQLSKLTADLRAVMGPHALIGIDQEGGAVVRATWLPSPPAAMSLGASNDVALAHTVGAAVARGIRSLGFNWNFAPVLDLNNNPANPVIGERSFGSDPQRATELALAWMEGSLSEGVACCVKHFPGHGDTHVDSHRDLPTVDKPRSALDALELAPFKAARRAPAMMSAHIVYPALDAEHPATLSRKILTDLLRTEWDYRGVIITDGMDMHAIAGRYGVGKAAVQALAAGADMVMALGNRSTQEETLTALTAALSTAEQGSNLDSSNIEARLVRLDSLAVTYPCAAFGYLTEPADQRLMVDAWRRGLTVTGNPQRLADGAKVRLVACADASGDGVAEAGLPASAVADLLARRYDVDLVTFDDAEAFDWAALPDDGRTVILASTTRLRYGARARQSWRPDLHLALWNPFQTLDIAAPALITYGFSVAALDAVGDWLAGTLEAHGKIPLAAMVSSDLQSSQSSQ